MSVELLLREFERLAEAPDAVDRLRRFVLDLAMRGQLVEQFPEGETGTQLLSRLREFPSERDRSPATNIHTVPENAAWFRLPNGWEWCYLGDVGKIVGGATPPASDPANFAPGGTAVAWLTPADLGKHKHLEISHGARDLSAKGLAACSATLMPKGAVLFSSRAPIGYVAIAANPIATNQGFKSVVPYVGEMSEYIALYFRAFRRSIDARASGTTFREVSGKAVAGLAFPLPPLAEQHRIVARAYELIALCDELEATQKERESQRNALRTASLRRLTLPDRGAASSQEDVRFLLDNWPRLITKTGHVASIRQVILDLAIKGRLVGQDPADEPAASLLDRIARKRDELLASDFPNAAEARVQRKKQDLQKLPPTLPDLPAGWNWATLMQCSAIVVDCRNKTAPYTSSGVTLLRTTNVRNGRITLEGHRYVSEETFRQWSSRYQPQPGDIVITREAPMGEVARIPEELRVCLGQRLMLARLVDRTINADFLVYSLRDSELMGRVQDKPIGALVEHLRVGGVETLLVPVPPLAEQQRIVAKVDELMAICDELETALASVQLERGRLLETLLHDVLAEGVGVAATASL